MVIDLPNADLRMPSRLQIISMKPRNESNARYPTTYRSIICDHFFEFLPDFQHFIFGTHDLDYKKDFYMDLWGVLSDLFSFKIGFL